MGRMGSSMDTFCRTFIKEVHESQHDIQFDASATKVRQSQGNLHGTPPHRQESPPASLRLRCPPFPQCCGHGAFSLILSLPTRSFSMASGKNVCSLFSCETLQKNCSGVMSIAHRFLDLHRHFGCMCGLFFLVQSWYGDHTTPLQTAMMVMMLPMSGACYVSRRQGLHRV